VNSDNDSISEKIVKISRISSYQQFIIIYAYDMCM